MPFYVYKVRTSDGRTQKGKVDAANQEKAAETLQERGLLVISLTPVAEKKQTLLGSNQGMTFNDTVVFTRQLASMVEAGLTLVNAISLLMQQAKPAMATVLSQIVNDLEGGLSFTQALQKHPKIFSKTYISLVQAGESSGSLDKVLNRLALTMEEQKDFNGKVRNALIYPVVVLIVMVAVIIVMMVAVIPKLLGVFEEFNAQLPVPTLILIAISNFFVHYWWLILIILAIATVVFIAWYRDDQAKKVIDKLYFNLPLVGDLRKKTILANFTQTLSMLIKSGVPLVDSLTLVTESLNSIVYREYFTIAKEKVERGVNLGDALEIYDDLPPILIQMIKVGEETGKLDDVMERLSGYFKTESQQAVTGLMSAFEPILMIILGLAVAFLVVAIILPIYNLTGQIT